jgi:hypothetical protein
VRGFVYGAMDLESDAPVWVKGVAYVAFMFAIISWVAVSTYLESLVIFFMPIVILVFMAWQEYQRTKGGEK